MSVGYYSYKGRYEVLDNAEPVADEIWREHIAAFIQNFIVKDKRSRWQHLYLEKPEKGRRASPRFYNDLIWELCPKLDYESQLELTNQDKKGIYYEFSGQAWWLSPLEAFRVGHGFDSLFSVREGEVYVCFWHEMDEYLCQKPKDKNTK
jgi:hypothetical protein